MIIKHIVDGIVLRKIAKGQYYIDTWYSSVYQQVYFVEEVLDDFFNQENLSLTFIWLIAENFVCW